MRRHLRRTTEHKSRVAAAETFNTELQTQRVTNHIRKLHISQPIETMASMHDMENSRFHEYDDNSPDAAAFAAASRATVAIVRSVLHYTTDFVHAINS